MSATLGVVGGLAASSFLPRMIPVPALQSGFGGTAAKVGIGIFGGMMLKRFSAPMAASFTAGALASAAFDLINTFRAGGGAVALPGAPAVAGYGDPYLLGNYYDSSVMGNWNNSDVGAYAG
jgi:hypothetical protein